MGYINSALREKYPEDRLHILAAKGNSGSYTYDGIELGAERVTQEIEGFLEALEREGRPVEKLSMVGYSLGGLVARYVIGLLYSRGWFSKIEPINFTTFATPHLGVRTPILGVHSRFWNLLGSRTLSTSGRQLFTIDSFRDSNRPILSVLADPSSIFIRALTRFKNRVLYSNIINDRSAPYYTTSISSTDPFKNLDNLDLNYLPSYSPNILDPSVSFSPKGISPPEPLYARLASTSQAFLNGLPSVALFSILIPVGAVAFLINSGIQSVRSQQRIRLHESGGAGISLVGYRIPLMIENARNTVEDRLRHVETVQGNDLSDTVEEPLRSSQWSEKSEQPHAIRKRTVSYSGGEETPALALTEEQFTMIDNLNAVGFRKYKVHIHKVRHSHAAIIVRSSRKTLDEGKVVVRHWLEEEFEI